MSDTLHAFFNDVLKEGALEIIRADGSSFVAGQSQDHMQLIPALRLHDKGLEIRLLRSVKSAIATGYAGGTISVERGTLYDALRVIARNMGPIQSHPKQKGGKLKDTLFSFKDQYNTFKAAKENVSAHYDLSDDFFKLFLDDDMQYSSAYFPEGDEDLETAQQKKQDYVIDLMDIPEHAHILDIGSGWGGLAKRIALRYPNVTVTGITLSDNQLETSRERAAEASVNHRVLFESCDYRTHKNTYDRIVSVEMLEHVGRNYYDEYFGALKRLLKPGGKAVICSGGRKTPQPRSNAFMNNHIFPGYYTPALSQLMPSIEKQRLWMTHLTCDKRHYVRTLELWYTRLLERREEVEAMFGDQFFRMWELYFIGARLGYDCGYWMLFHMVLYKDDTARDPFVMPERVG